LLVWVVIGDLVRKPEVIGLQFRTRRRVADIASRRWLERDPHCLLVDIGPAPVCLVVTIAQIFCRLLGGDRGINWAKIEKEVSAKTAW